MSSDRKLYKAAMLIRKTMIPPVMATLFLLAVYLYPTGTFVYPQDLAAALTGIVIFPIIAYPLSYLVPSLRKKGREGQRNLAFLFSAAGYLLSFLYSFLPGRSGRYQLITLVYLFSVIMLVVFNKLLGIRASGHSCSVSGPLFACLMLLGIKSLFPCLILWLLSLWASVITKRHTLHEFFAGALASLIAIGAAVLTVNLI